MNSLRNCPAPAKLNLFLHVTGRRADGYHLLESAFQLIDLGDTLHFTSRRDGRIVRINALAQVPESVDLTVRAAKLLQEKSGCEQGVELTLEKKIPMGGGLGGGSSDAATTLLALNRLWGIGMKRVDLIEMGLSLGADVPFFLFGHNAFARGIGEALWPLQSDSRFFAVIFPGVEVPTRRIFEAPELTRDTVPIKMADFCADALKPELPRFEDGFGHNDLEPVAVAHYPEVGAALAWLGRFGPARMSGSGACVFCAFSSRAAAEESLVGIPDRWSGWACASLTHHPLASWAA
ncbi:MAG: 4-(cytidine 5'-diphospho)-2-C-methyl-D-erythritol kinase [Burkholderiaceae bacterium]